MVVQIDDAKAIVFQFRNEQVLALKIDGQMIDAPFDVPQEYLVFQLQGTLLRLSCALKQCEGQDKQHKRVNTIRCEKWTGWPVCYESHHGEIWSGLSVCRFTSVIIVTAQTPGLGIDDDTTGLLILRSHHLEVASLAGDEDIAPTVSLHFFTDLLLADWPFAVDEGSALATFTCEIVGGDGPHEHHSCNRPHQDFG